MKIKRFHKFNNNSINESENIPEGTNELLYYSFDWDDNILHMSTVIHMDQLVDGEWTPTTVSTSKFAEVRNDKENWRIINNDPTEAFSEFRDFGPRGANAFIEDTEDAIRKGDFGPSWDAFIQCLVEGSIFSIVTARGHESETIKNAVEYVIDNQLSSDQQFEMYAQCLKFAHLFGENTDNYERIPKGKLSQTKLIQNYLNFCDYYGVSSPSFAKKLNLGAEVASNPEKAKEMAIKVFAEKIHKYSLKINRKASLGFSDDDIKNVEHIDKVFSDELSISFPMSYNIYNTSDRKIKGGVHKRIKRFEN